MVLMSTHNHQSTVPQVAADYFSGVLPHNFATNRDRPQVAGYDFHPTIAQVFRPGRGWTDYPGIKRISPSWACKLRTQGITHIALRVNNRVADFDIKELVK
jgi:hypothetical protein